MIQIYPGDLLQILAENNRFYYVIILEKISLFGGQFCFALYRTSETPIESTELMKGPLEGFYETVDFIWAKREKRVTRIAKKLDVEKLNSAVQYFIHSFGAFKKKDASQWGIVDRKRNSVKTIYTVTDEEKKYPSNHCIGYNSLLKLIDSRYAPEKEWD